MKKKINFHHIFFRGNKLAVHKDANKNDERKLKKKIKNTKSPPRNRQGIRCSYVI
jgi:hypothetical protein